MIPAKVAKPMFGRRGRGMRNPWASQGGWEARLWLAMLSALCNFMACFRPADGWENQMPPRSGVQGAHRYPTIVKE